ncbi:MAG: hypothetical protein HY790_00745 [Deltaproteobacteria bacterium]|nr:hypothetical protein [Deltaproteobacteria bacterium]
MDAKLSLAVIAFPSSTWEREKELISEEHMNPAEVVEKVKQRAQANFKTGLN